MTSRKAASAEADAQKKRKREKIEDAGRSKKRKPQDDKDETTAMVVKQLGEVSKAAETRRGGRSGSWKLSEPMGGCMSDIDPIFTADEGYV